MPSFMAKWSQKYPGLLRPHPPEPVATARRNLFYDAKSTRSMSKLFESYLAGQVACLMEFAPMFWPTINSYKRLVDGFWAPVKPTWGVGQPHRELPRDRRQPEEHAARNALPRRRRQPLSRDGRGDRGRHARRREGPEAHRAADHRHQPGCRRHPARAALAAAQTTRNFKESAIARDWFGDTFVDHFAATRDWEYRQWQDAVTDWELKRYFEII